MNRWRPVHARTERDLLRPRALLVGLTAAAGALLLAHMSLLPQPLVLPALAVTALGCAAALALVAWWRQAARDGERITLGDVAGASAAIGLAAATLGDPDQVLHLFDRLAVKE